MSEVLRALEGPIAPMICATDDPEHATVCDRTSSLHRQRAVGPRPRRRRRCARLVTLADLVPQLPSAPIQPTPIQPDDRSREPDRPVTTDTDQHLVIRGLRVAPIASPGARDPPGHRPEVGTGEVHAIMGPNGSGKTTLAYALMGHPAYKVTGGEVIWNGRDILALSPDKRARLGMFLAFQYPTAIPGPAASRASSGARSTPSSRASTRTPTSTRRTRIKGGVSMMDFRKKMREKLALLRMDEGFAARYVNEGFSGGEKKRLEMLQMAMLEPEMAILDETDSGLDIDALRVVAEGVNAMLNPNLGVLLITHYQRLLNYITPDVVHVLAQGRIVKSGGKDLALRLEDEGYGPILREAGLAPDVPDEALLVPQGPELDLEPVEAAR